MKNLILIPLSFPYDIGGEFTFLNEEIKYYKGNFSKVVILPTITSETKTKIDNSYVVDKSLSLHNNLLSIKDFKYLFKDPLFLISELISNVSKNKVAFRTKKAFIHYLLIMKSISFFEKYFSDKQEEWIIYTYWYTHITIAAERFAIKRNNLKTITRAHGIDLFEERNNNYFPFRKQTITGLNKIIFISKFGENYLKSKYKLDSKISTTLGIGNYDFNITTKKSKPNQFSIVSCSVIDTNKRVDLIFESLCELANLFPNIFFTWSHFGDGDLYSILKEKVYSINIKNLNINLFGKVKNEKVIEYYKSNPVDVFITTSSSEGRPFSIMEALCCSIPVIATSVGGIPELVSNFNGILISENPKILEVTQAIKSLVINQKESLDKSEGARKVWEEKCNAENVFPEFIKMIKSL